MNSYLLALRHPDDQLSTGLILSLPTIDGGMALFWSLTPLGRQTMFNHRTIKAPNSLPLEKPFLDFPRFCRMSIDEHRNWLRKLMKTHDASRAVTRENPAKEIQVPSSAPLI
jgi:hypothetical protein